MSEVPREIVDAAIAAGELHGRPVVELSLTLIAEHAGVSRSTLLRRIGFSRTTLDDAVRAAGVDPGERRTVRERATEAAAELVAESGLAALTMEAVAARAGCSLPSVNTAFSGRDGLLTAVFERYSPLHDLEAVMAARRDHTGDPVQEFGRTVREIHRALVTAFDREPRVMPALAADLLARPQGPATLPLRRNLPRLLDTIRDWLTEAMDAGLIRRMPLPSLAHLLVAPVALDALTRPALATDPDIALPTVEEACEVFAAAFLRATQPPADHTDPRSSS